MHGIPNIVTGSPSTASEPRSLPSLTGAYVVREPGLDIPFPHLVVIVEGRHDLPGDKPSSTSFVE
jgi:hypothetical protein